MDILRDLQNEEPLIREIREIIRKEYVSIKEKSHTLSELKSNCEKRWKEISYRNSEIGITVQREFKALFNEELVNHAC